LSTLHPKIPSLEIGQTSWANMRNIQLLL